jgi:hypothetical protein
MGAVALESGSLLPLFSLDVHSRRLPKLQFRAGDSLL